MENIIIYSSVMDYNTLSVENSERIRIPVDYLSDYYPLLSSDLIEFNEFDKFDEFNKIDEYNGIIDFINGIYSRNYLENFKLNTNNTLCEQCTYENDIENDSCIMCENQLDKQIRTYLDNDNDTLITENTFDQVIDTIKILKYLYEIYENTKNAYLLIRPPGHHAHHDHHEGFCIINNSYILAKNLVNHKTKNVLIFDWDLHHGNGTEKLIRDNNDNNIYFISMHGYAPDFYPRTGLDNPDNNLNILNIPLAKGTNHIEYMEIFNNKVKSFINNLITDQKMDFDCIIISNGLDGHKDDKYGFLELEDETYLQMTEYFLSLNKKLFFLLEGGYNAELIAIMSHKIINLF